jgi:rSAM/selenodomain-associated transferase 2
VGNELSARPGRVDRGGQPRLSVIVPALDEAAHIGITLRDLDGCRIPATEVLVVDGHSTDATREIAEPLCDRVIEAPRGRACQMNVGADWAQGDILWFLHADTRVPADAAALIDTAVASGRAWGRFDVRLSGKRPLLRIVERTMNLRSCLSGIVTGDQGLFVTRALFRSVGGYPDIPLMEDIALSRRLRRRQRPACLGIRLVTSSRRWERDGVWRTVLLMWWLRTAYALGADPARLAQRYRGADPSY